jgi:hypothetical protein
MQRLSLRAGFQKDSYELDRFGLSFSSAHILFYVLRKHTSGGGEVSGGGTHYM